MISNIRSDTARYRFPLCVVAICQDERVVLGPIV
jgi:hypothetical protein